MPAAVRYQRGGHRARADGSFGVFLGWSERISVASYDYDVSMPDDLDTLGKGVVTTFARVC